MDMLKRRDDYLTSKEEWGMWKGQPRAAWMVANFVGQAREKRRYFGDMRVKSSGRQ